MPQVNWTEILSFYNIRKYALHHASLPPEERPSFPAGTLTYKAKIKLHGTNGGIRVYQKDGVKTVQGQTRTTLVLKDSDNHSFGTLVKSLTTYLLSLTLPEDCTIFGEYAGPGIQDSVALNSIPKKHFFVFAIVVGETIITEPEELSALLPALPEQMKILPWHSTIDLDWLDTEENLTKLTERISTDVLAVEKEDPYVKEVFGVSGTGEGLVYYPPFTFYAEYCSCVFKAKGEKHKNIATAKPASVNAESAASIDEFVALVLTPARLAQGKSQFPSPSQKDTGAFITWMVTDVKKETSAELEASSLTFKDVENKVKSVARTWYLEEMKRDAMKG